MQAEAAVGLILKTLCSAVKARYEQHAHAPRPSRLEVEIDASLVLIRPAAENGRFRDLHEDHLARPDVRAALGKAADELKAALPPGAFPFRIDARIEFYGSRSDCSVKVEEVTFNAAGIGSKPSFACWREPLDRLSLKLELLHHQEPETMDKQAYYMIREYAETEGFAEPHKFYASSPSAARNKALMIAAPSDACRLFSGAVSDLDEAGLRRLEPLHVCPAGPSMADLLEQQDNVPSPA